MIPNHARVFNTFLKIEGAVHAYEFDGKLPVLHFGTEPRLPPVISMWRVEDTVLVGPSYESIDFATGSPPRIANELNSEYPAYNRPPSMLPILVASVFIAFAAGMLIGRSFYGD